MFGKKVMNWILYGNTKGMPTNQGKSSNEYNDFLSKVFSKKECIGCHTTENLEKCKGQMCYDCWKKETIDEE